MRGETAIESTPEIAEVLSGCFVHVHLAQKSCLEGFLLGSGDGICRFNAKVHECSAVGSQMPFFPLEFRAIRCIWSAKVEENIMTDRMTQEMTRPMTQKSH
eukprot:4556223-Amphidinium_carterae.1